MANSIIQQQPAFRRLPVGQDVIFVVSNDDAVGFQKRVKFVAEVHISTGFINLSDPATVIGTFKTTPNNAGVGIFNFKNIIENYVKADHIAGSKSKYKTVDSDGKRHPIHLIDQFSLQTDTLRYFGVQFKVEYLGATDASGSQDDNVVRTATGTAANADIFTMFNAYLKHTDVLQFSDDADNLNGFGYKMTDFDPKNTTRQFLTNLPTSLYANIEDYGTIGILGTNQTSYDNARQVTFTYYSSAGAPLGSDTYTKTGSTGALFTWSTDSRKQIVYLGIYPGNLRNWSTTFNTLVTDETIQDGYYTVQLKDATGTVSSKLYTVNLNCPDQRQYESIRLCWLNQWGVWDYYTFTKKSIKKINAKETTYTQLEGTWNERTYSIDGFRGGKKTFRRNSTESISVNTDFVKEEYNTVFEELINSPEVYLLKGFQDDLSDPVLNQYVVPVRVTTKSFVSKTVANDKLIQYKFDIEKSLNLRTQSI